MTMKQVLNIGLAEIVGDNLGYFETLQNKSMSK
jgi:hypothetical protein